jgi:hypothetical protein
MDQGDLTSPPPAYSEQEFDQKISTVVHVSLSAPQPPLEPLDGEEQWEEWDDAAFQAAAQAVSSWGSQPTGSQSSQGSGAGSSARSQVSHPALESEGDNNAQSPDLPAIEPLRIHKKARSPTSPSKPRPSWFAETEIDPQSNASGSIQHDIPPEDEEDRSIPPPPFTAVAPSIDGRPVIIMSYQPGDSRSPSPLNSPVRTSLEIPPYDCDSVTLSRPSSRTQHPPQSYTEQFHANTQATSRSYRPTRQSLPAGRALPAIPRPIGQRPLTTFSSKPTPSFPTPRMNFNPYVAYGQSEGISDLPPARHPQQHFDPKGFYKYGQLNFCNRLSAESLLSSAVSAHLTPSQTPARQLHL